MRQISEIYPLNTDLTCGGTPLFKQECRNGFSFNLLSQSLLREIETK